MSSRFDRQRVKSCVTTLFKPGRFGRIAGKSIIRRLSLKELKRQRLTHLCRRLRRTPPSTGRAFAATIGLVNIQAVARPLCRRGTTTYRSTPASAEKSKVVSDVVEKTSTSRRNRICYAAVEFFRRRRIEDDGAVVEKLHKNAT